MRVDQEQLAALVGDMAAFMIFGQRGVWVGKSITLRRVGGRGKVNVIVTKSGTVRVKEQS